MKKHLSFLRAAVLIGLFTFVLFYSVFDQRAADAFGYALAGALGGLAGEYMRQWQPGKSKKNHQS